MRKLAKSVSEATRCAILDTAWLLMASDGRLDVGMAEVGSEHWRAVTEEGRLLPVDTHVTVIRVEGTRVVVRAVA